MEDVVSGPLNLPEMGPELDEELMAGKERPGEEEEKP